MNILGGSFVDLYELTMMQSCVLEGKNKNAVFDFYIRFRKEVPRRYYVFCGLEYLLEALENLRFDKETIEYLSTLDGLFDKRFLDYLEGFRFTGDVYALDEGRIVFPDEPIVEISAPLPEAQFVETLVLNLLQFSILSATKAARCFSVARGKMLVDFGARRAHSPFSAETTARSAYICGFNGTSLISAGKKYSIPVYGTMAHSFIMIYDSEEEAFEKFARLYKRGVLLVDTYDIEKGTRNAIKVIKKLKEEGIKITALRTDSGDPIESAKMIRKLLDENDLKEISIFISGGVNEYKIRDILERTEGVGGFGVGTELSSSADQPYLDCAYKLVEYDGKPKMKLSEEKQNLPGRKKLIRLYRNNKMIKDIVGLSDEEIELKEEHDSSELLLKKVMEKGKISDEYSVIKDKPKYIRLCRERFMKDFEMLPKELKDLSAPNERLYPVAISPGIQKLVEELESRSQER